MQNELIDSADNYLDELMPGTKLLRGQYEIESYLVRGGFGVTYLARDSLDRQVVIKECFPVDICCRMDGQVHASSPDQQSKFSSILRHFLREARRLSRLSHANIVGVHQVFEENGTAYMSLDFIDGMDLLSVIEEDPKRLTPEIVRSMLMKSLGAISYIHGKDILHRDISPDNILLDRADNLKLIDFGAAREQATKENRELSSLMAVKDGYSPQEFYLSDVTQYPSSDLYSLGATFYHLITGRAPPNSQQRLAAIATGSADPYRPLAIGPSEYDYDFLKAIDNSLKVFPEDRIQSAQEWVEAIDAERRSQAVDARAKSESTIQVKISELVAEVNKDLHPPAARRDDAPNPPSAGRANRARAVATPTILHERKPPAPPVDMFGNPIDDVDAWLKSQDRGLNSARGRGSAAAAVPRVEKRSLPGFKRASASASASVSSEVECNPEGAVADRDSPQGSRFFKALISRLSRSRPNTSKNT